MTEQDVIDAAIAFHHAGRALKAVTLLRRVLGFNPANHNALRLYGVFLRQAGQAQASIPWLERAVALHPFVPVFHQDLQKSYEALGRADLASASYCRALLAEIRAGLGPKDAPPHPLGWSPEPGRTVPIAPRGQRRDPVILFVSERWFLLDPRRGDSNCLIFTIDGRETVIPGASVGFFVDDLARGHGLPLDSLFARAVAEIDPDVVMLSPQVNGLLTALDPSVATLAGVKRRHGFKLAVMLYDMADDWGVAPVAPVAPLAGLVDLVVSLDLPPPLAQARLPELLVLGAWSPVDGALFHDDGGPRDIPISFVGQVRAARAVFLTQAQEAGLSIHVAGGQRGDAPLSLADYAATLRRSQMTINLPLSQTGGAPHVKGRVFEALLSGALLLEQANPATEHWLRPMEHYVPFTDAADLAAKARHFLEHPAEARAIAERGRDHVRDRLNPAAFWRAVQARLG